MRTDTIISVDNLSKRYRIGARESYRTFRETLVEAISTPLRGVTAVLRRPSAAKPRPSETIWALKDVSFEVQRGEVVGIIGRNGAGKSTLLKILSKITEPTSGRVELRGRVGSLLEVGTGFHPELTGHENIYLYGAILGMDRREVTRKFDEIVAFAELEKFIDTPVKRYSSGMYMRLAFAVAAHLDPEILLVDEVLAVGDLGFQKKCLGKMNDVSRQGRTVLFVTHNMGAVRSLCSRAILLRNGTVQQTGSSQAIAAEYENEGVSKSGEVWINPDPEDRQQSAFIESLEVINGEGKRKSVFSSSERIRIKFRLHVNSPSPDLKVGFDILRNGTVVFRSQQVDSPAPVDIAPGAQDLFCEIPPDLLNAGTYHIVPIISLHLIKGLRKDDKPVLEFCVDLDTTRSPFHTVLNARNHPGAVFPLLHWKTK